MKRMSNAALLGFEDRLRREIEEIERQIRELTLEKQALERQLLKARRASTVLSDVSRKNSLTRILVEEKILDALRGAKRSLSNSQLYREAQAIDADLKSSTFRTYLHRMKARGLILTAGTNGNWRLPSQQVVLKTFHKQVT